MPAGSSSFPDYFSSVAAQYAANRPQYPEELFAWLASLVAQHELALDVGTGNGQAATRLAEHFSQVIATDPSAEQLANAVQNERVSYRIAKAEESGLQDQSADLITAATAAHWFDHMAFHAEVDRVLKPGGVLAVWNYSWAVVTPKVDAVVDRFRTFVQPYWPAGREHIDTGYRTLPFPYLDLSGVPEFACRMQWTADRFLGYIGTWSAVQAARRVLPDDPINALAPELREAWGENVREVRSPIAMRVGRKPLP